MQELLYLSASLLPDWPSQAHECIQVGLKHMTCSVKELARQLRVCCYSKPHKVCRSGKGKHRVLTSLHHIPAGSSHCLQAEGHAAAADPGQGRALL